MTPAGWSLLAFVVAVGLSCTSRINVGLVALALAWAVGALGAGMKPDAVAAGFPAGLFLTLAGVTLLFSLAETNGTLEALARRGLTLLREPRWLPPLVFLLASLLSAVGPGAVAATALVAPAAMALGARAGTPALLTALMIGNGANAGNLSPLSAVGIIARDGMAKAGITGAEAKTFVANFLAHVLVGAAALLLFGRRPPRDSDGLEPAPALPPLEPRQRQTAGVLAMWTAAALVLGVPVGFGAFAAAMVLILLGAASEADAVRRMPWGVILMVTGMTTLVAVLEKTGGMDLVTGLLARFSTPASVDGVVAFVTGLISTWSSTSGVVMPAFLPTSRALVERLGGGDPLAVALSINVGSSLVDVSPLSTIGALCVAAAPAAIASELFRKLMIWGLSMAVVGALLAQLFCGPLARL